MAWNFLGDRILWLRAADYVRRHQPKLIGITGSTSAALAQRAVAAVLSTRYRVRETPHKNTTPRDVVRAILGVDTVKRRAGWMQLLTASRMREYGETEPEALVLALPLTKPGDIDAITTRLPFSCGVVIDIHTARMSLFSTIALRAHEVASLITNLPKNGSAILNADDPLIHDMRLRTRANVLLVGASNDATVRLARTARLSSFGLACEIVVDGALHEAHLPHIIGRHQLPALLAALAVAKATDVDVAGALTRLGKLKPPPGHLTLVGGAHDSLILDDSYDATPESMVDALTTLHELGVPRSLGGQRAIRRRIAVISDIPDIGTAAQKWYEKIGRTAGETAHVVVCVGEDIQKAGAAALRAGADVHHIAHSRDVGKWLSQFLKQGDVTLVCGSRSMRMEETVRRLLADPERDEHLVVHTV